VTEAIKHFTGIGEMLAGELLVYDGASMRFLRARVERRPDCPACGRV
jgi:adenylyltransferase/sulfurtransferase